MTVRAKPWTFESNSNTSSCDGSNGTIDGWSGGDTNDFLQQLVDECGELCEPGSGTMDITVQHMADWNMVGLPLGMEDTYYLSLFPDAIDNTLFSFGEGYSLETNLVEGTGYWLRFDEPATVAITGTAIQELSINLLMDWNLISGISDVVDISQINDPDGIIIPGTFYGFEDTYTQVSQLEPGRGYWVRTNNFGEIILFGIALSVQKPRTNFTNSIGLSIIVIFLYYLLIKFGQTLGYNDIINPFIYFIV